jgi:hypothetical protein
MLKRFTILTVALFALGAGVAVAQTQPSEAAYEADLAKRADGVLEVLRLEDDGKATRVRDALITQYRSLRTLHDARDAKLKELPKDDKDAATKVKGETDQAVKKLHEEFVAKLNSELTAEQVEKVKDKMTYNVVQVTYNGFCDMLPELTEAQKGYILAQLKEARELAMDGGSSKEKHAIFGKYKGRINNYLSKQGYDLKKAGKEWAERRKARESGKSATQPS